VNNQQLLEPVKINPAILVWARTRLDLSIDDAAALLGHPPEQVSSWEEATAEPTYKQAMMLARKLQFPFGYLFLSKEPESTLPLPDLRTVAGAERGIPTPNLLAVLEDAIRKQHWYTEMLREEGVRPLPFVGRFAQRQSVEVIAADIRQQLQVNEQTRSECPNTASFLSQLVRNAEMLGILVLRSGTACGNTHRPLSVDEFRGFAITDSLAPIVFINTRDANVAQLFTFAHEIAHIWIGAEGVSNPDFRKKSREQINVVEALCNQIAAEVLVPTHNFSREWNVDEPLDRNIENIRLRYRVSRFVVLRKAFDKDFITTKEYYAKLKQFYDFELAKKAQKDEEDSGGHYYHTLYARNSIKFTSAVTEAFSGGRLLVTEACSLLGIKTGVLKTIVAAV